jgi:nucleoside permease NupC
VVDLDALENPEILAFFMMPFSAHKIFLISKILVPECENKQCNENNADNHKKNERDKPAE